MTVTAKREICCGRSTQSRYTVRGRCTSVSGLLLAVRTIIWYVSESVYNQFFLGRKCRRLMCCGPSSGRTVSYKRLTSFSRPTSFVRPSRIRIERGWRSSRRRWGRIRWAGLRNVWILDSQRGKTRRSLSGRRVAWRLDGGKSCIWCYVVSQTREFSLRVRSSSSRRALWTTFRPKSQWRRMRWRGRTTHLHHGALKRSRSHHLWTRRRWRC